MNKQKSTKPPNQRNPHELQAQIHAGGLASSSLPSENILKKKKKKQRQYHNPLVSNVDIVFYFHKIKLLAECKR